MTAKILLTCLLLCSSLGSAAQDAERSDLPSSTLIINPLGLLQFGPMFQYETRMGNSSAYLVPHLRLGYLGVVTHLLWTGFEDDAILSPLNLGVGLGVRGLSTFSTNSNAFYWGGFLEYSIGKARYSVGEIDETEEISSNLQIIANAGYRWRFPSGRSISVGVYVGPSLTLSDEERFVESGELYDTYNQTIFFGMLELAFGWEKN